ncbi:hypothetical protein D9758_007857 [Tetrapyrgos nigripes]|uniref:Uncharacterized protein n=1 Tax=Tetrapyrgos nigripes TaxID=182062 RepID=A0A8H5CY93_9AGAR|nr:hypothetical protein D9758_007857 [Tetrapyrgos nigripes]
MVAGASRYSRLVSYITSALSFSLNISDENPTAFSPTTVTWTRDSSDPSGWWLDEHDVNNPSNKVLSIQVDNSGATSGTVPFVFIRNGTFQIIATNTGNDDGGFFTSTPINVRAALDATSSSCPSPSPSVSNEQSTQSPSSNSSGASTGALVGAVIGSLAFGFSTGTVIMFLVFRRRIARLQAAAHQPEKSDDSNDPSPMQSTSRLNLVRPSRNTPAITPFTAMSPSSDFSSPKSKSNPPERFATSVEGSTQGTSSSVSWSAFRDEKTPPAVMSYDTAPDTATAHDEHAVSSYQNVPTGERQRLLEDEAKRLRLQVLAMVNQALSTGEQENDLRTENRQMAAQMERMKAQIEMLEAQQNSDWARGLTDEPPSYLTSIASQ